MALTRRGFVAAPIALAALDARGLAAEPALPPFEPEGSERFLRPDVHAGDRPAGASFASRSAALGLNGAAGAAHPLAVLAAIDTLKAGGSAADAAIALNACLGFLEPVSAGLGGDCFAFVWNSQTAALESLAGSGRSPRALSLETVRARSPIGHIAPLGAISVSVPGALSAWWALHQRHGKLPWANLFAPAIDLCQNGAPVPQIIGYYIKRNMAAFARNSHLIEESDNAKHVYAPGGTPPDFGTVFKNPDLAGTYRAIAEGGRDAFYNGPIAEAIQSYFRRIGGWMTKQDLDAQVAHWGTPLSTTYRGTTVYAMDENTQGLATLQILNILENFDLRGAGFQSARSLHWQVEAKRLAFEDRARYYADPNFADIPVSFLNSKAYAAQRAALIRDTAVISVTPGEAPSHGDTTYFTVADRSGMMVSMIQSNFRGMGSGLVSDAPGSGADWRTLGFMFQDRGQLFSLKPGHPNIYAPGKRPFQTIIPGFAARGGQPWMSFGVMGGDMQPQGQAQIIINRTDYGLDLQAAGDAPRWHHEGSSQSMGEDSPDLPPTGLLRLESGVPVATQKALAALGHVLGPSDGGFGRYHAIEPAHPQGIRTYTAASEMRADGLALAY